MGKNPQPCFIALSPPEHPIDEPYTGNSDRIYLGYFEDEDDQFVFRYDRQTREAALYCGASGWHDPYPVVDGRTEPNILGPRGSVWLLAAWSSATGEYPKHEQDVLEIPLPASHQRRVDLLYSLVANHIVTPEHLDKYQRRAYPGCLLCGRTWRSGGDPAHWGFGTDEQT